MITKISMTLDLITFIRIPDVTNPMLHSYVFIRRPWFPDETYALFFQSEKTSKVGILLSGSLDVKFFFQNVFISSSSISTCLGIVLFLCLEFIVTILRGILHIVSNCYKDKYVLSLNFRLLPTLFNTSYCQQVDFSSDPVTPNNVKKQ